MGPQTPARWYQGVSRYQWLVLVVASLGWVFDVFEGQIFVAAMGEAMPALLRPGAPAGEVAFYTNLTLGAFLVGGAVGGVIFGMVADRFGRRAALGFTILIYSAFTCLSALSQTWWQMAAFRFLVALGVGGEWAVASALVAEVFPSHARAWSQSIFHASSVLGTYLAAGAGVFILANPKAVLSLPVPGGPWETTGWRLGFLLGAVPALLVVWVRLSLREPQRWLAVHGNRAGRSRAGSVASLFGPDLLRRTLVGVGLAAVGLATFWGTHIYGKDTLRRAYEARYLASVPLDAPATARDELLRANGAVLKRWEMLGMFLVTTGGGVGLVCFGPVSERLGRRGAFLLFLLGGLGSSLVLFQLLSGVAALCLFLPVFGFLTLGMHAGFAVYFPELFPTRLRGVGGGLCFNVGRLVAAPVLLLAGWMQRDRGWTPAATASALSLLFLTGAVVLVFAPETRGRELPE